MTFTPTTEQLNIVEAALTGQNLAISAFAGAAKTTSCQLIAKAVRKPSLYIAFNKSIATEASEKFPPHVECRTLHSLAYETIIKPNPKLRKQLQPYLNYKEVDSFFQERFAAVSIDTIFMILDCLKEWCQSAYTQIDKFAYDFFVETMAKAKNGESRFSYKNYTESDANEFVILVMQIWLEQKECRMTITHDTYLKLYHLKKPNMIDRFSTIYLDEAQDSNDVTLDIVYNAEKQGCQIIMVGDPYQSIYEWRGAINAFDTVPADFKKLYLTQSFRFPQSIADKANVLLDKLGCEKQIEGKGQTLGEFDEKPTILCRVNASIFNYCIDACKQGQKVYIIGDLSEFFSALMTANNIKYNGDKSKRYNKQIAVYKEWSEILKAAQFQLEISKIVNFLDRFPNIYEVIKQVKEVIVSSPEEADLILATLHKSKGLEWDTVVLCDDVIPLKFKDMTGENQQEEFLKELKKDQLGNLLYVGITRAKQKLIMSSDLQNLLGV